MVEVGGKEEKNTAVVMGSLQQCVALSPSTHIRPPTLEVFAVVKLCRYKEFSALTENVPSSTVDRCSVDCSVLTETRRARLNRSMESDTKPLRIGNSEGKQIHEVALRSADYDVKLPAYYRFPIPEICPTLAVEDLEDAQTSLGSMFCLSTHIA